MANPRTARKKSPAARKVATKPPLQRLLWALRRVRAGEPLKATHMAEEFEVSVRTAYRDLDFKREGRIKGGADADLLVLTLENPKDTATYTDPYPERA